MSEISVNPSKINQATEQVDKNSTSSLQGELAASISNGLSPVFESTAITVKDLSRFGVVNGESIENKDSILGDVNEALGYDRKKNPSIEYLITCPFGLIALPFGLGSVNYNWFGHSALRYTTPDGRDVVINVEAKEKGKNFLQFYDAKEYLYGTNPVKSGPQKGVYQRDFIGLRVENVDPEYIEKMHAYILELQAKDIESDHSGDVRFNIFFGPIFNFYAKYFPKNSPSFLKPSSSPSSASPSSMVSTMMVSWPEYGNCARWTSSMLYKAGLVTDYFVWPKTVFINLFENYYRTNIKTLDNMNIVYYEQPEHISQLAYGVKAKPVWFGDTIAPLQLFRNYFYGDLKSFVKVFVRIPLNDSKAIIVLRKNEKEISKPDALRNLVNSRVFIMSSVISSIILYKKGFNIIRSHIQRWKSTQSFSR